MKIGSSKGIVIPAEWCRQLHLKLQDYVLIKIEEENKLAVYKVPDRLQHEIKNVVVHVGKGDL